VISKSVRTFPISPALRAQQAALYPAPSGENKGKQQSAARPRKSSRAKRPALTQPNKRKNNTHGFKDCAGLWRAANEALWSFGTSSPPANSSQGSLVHNDLSAHGSTSKSTAYLRLRRSQSLFWNTAFPR
jgi:hypothetical protein